MTAAARNPAAVEASLGLDRPARRLIQQGLRNEGFDPGAPDGLFDRRTRATIRRGQEARTIPSMGYLDNTVAQPQREAAAASAPSSLTTASGTTSESPVVTTRPRWPAPAAEDPLAAEVTGGRDQATSPAGERQPATQAARTAQLPPEIRAYRDLIGTARCWRWRTRGHHRRNRRLLRRDPSAQSSRPTPLLTPRAVPFMIKRTQGGWGLLKGPTPAGTPAELRNWLQRLDRFWQG